ncbi:MAG TPA: tyrosine--tRNA ligase [archaeon]|nr:tyrosine--tRNA ligase [archaeon]
MDIERRVELAKRNTEEIIEESELVELLQTKKSPVVYCGYEPSRAPHLGNLVTTTKLIDFKKAGFKVIFLLGDMQAYTNLKGNIEEIERQDKIWEKAIKAFGLDAEFVRGVSFQFKKEYWTDIIDMSLKISVNRGLRAMQEIARDFEHAKVSQILYPLMQAEDIKMLGCDVAQGGLDQRKIHMLAREHLPEIGWRKPVCVHTPMIVSLHGAGEKMSKSIPGSGISLDDNDEYIDSAIKNAYCPAKVLQDNSIMQISKLIIFPRDKGLKIERDKKFGGDVEFTNYEEMERIFVDGGLHPMDLKNAVGRELKKIIAPARKYFKPAEKTFGAGAGV